jgi:hypothetical protein
MKNLWKSFIDFVVITIGKVHWGYKNRLTPNELEDIRQLLISNYYIILTHRNNHLSTFFVSLGNFLLTGKWSYWAHALMNLENEVKTDRDFRLIEATGNGIHYSPFELVFRVHGVALLKPKSMSTEHWTKIMDKARSELGKPYDSLFDLRNDNALSCVELVRTALMAEPDYAANFAEFESMISKNKNLTPQMFYDCSDFEVVYEVRRR